MLSGVLGVGCGDLVYEIELITPENGTEFTVIENNDAVVCVWERVEFEDARVPIGEIATSKKFTDDETWQFIGYTGNENELSAHLNKEFLLQCATGRQASTPTEPTTFYWRAIAVDDESGEEIIYSSEVREFIVVWQE